MSGEALDGGAAGAASLRDIARAAWRGWDRDGGFLLAGGLAFFIALSLSPLLIVGVGIARILFGSRATGGALAARLTPVIGAGSASAIQQTVLHTTQSGATGIALAVGIVSTLVGAGGLMLQVQACLDVVLGDPHPTGLRAPLAGVLKASMAVFVVGFFFVAVNAVSSVGSLITGMEPGRGIASLESAASAALLLAVLAFGYRYLSARGLPWSASLAGSTIAVVVSVASTFGVSLYLALGFAASAYGASASLFVFLLWLFSLGIAFVAGAEVANAWQQRWPANHVRR